MFAKDCTVREKYMRSRFYELVELNCKLCSKYFSPRLSYDLFFSVCR